MERSIGVYETGASSFVSATVLNYRSFPNVSFHSVHESKSLSCREQLRMAVSNIADPARTVLGVAAEATAAVPPASAASKGLLAVVAVGTVRLFKCQRLTMVTESFLW